MAVRSNATLLVLALLGLIAHGPNAAPTDQHRQWIQEMKSNPRGPFARLRWFCNDGTVHPPKPYPCEERGDGHQHGEWSEKTQQLRAAGYKVANVLAGTDADAFTAAADFRDAYNQILIEKYLIAVDDGWILRKAQFYRGAIQEEDERAGARELLLALAANPEWMGRRFTALRIGVGLLPHGEETASVQRVRQMSAALSDEDAGFVTLRAKIHGSPSADDAERVRRYAAKVEDPKRAAKYGELAREIDRVYEAVPLPSVLEKSAAIFTGGPWLQELLREAAGLYRAASGDRSRYQITASLLAELRDALPRIRNASARLRVLNVSLLVESDNFRTSAGLRERLPQASRRQRVEWLAGAVDAAYGTGVINARQRGELAKSLQRLSANNLKLGTYLSELSYLGNVPGWGTQGLRFYFYESMQKLGEIEPRALLFIQDQLRGSPLLFFSALLDSLLRDGNRLAGVRHKLFGEDIGVGFRALNPGLSRGVLHSKPDLTKLEAFTGDGIYLLPETVADLPPVAGILTAGEGNPLSHVQLLARNLGIPNVGVDQALIPRVSGHDGKNIVMAVSPGGLVELHADSSRWDVVFGENASELEVLIKPDLEKLDLSVNKFVSLDNLREQDSGRTVGPKAAKLGELRHYYPESVARGLAIPFGVFRSLVLEQPYRGTNRTVFEWMVDSYRKIQQLAPSDKRNKFTERFRAELYEIILQTDPGDDFRARLRAAMDTTFGPDGSYGVFVRSDTNVEDLPGFTGAGLNLTVFNAVGFDNVLEAISRVWASPFTARAFAWRQSLMTQPEHVYPAVLLLKSVSVEKSGVLVTQDLDTGERSVLSVAANEGVGGAVEGQAAESIRIDTRNGTVRLMASATAPWRNVLNPSGGVDRLPVTDADTVLQEAEVKQLITLAQELPNRFPPITDDRGAPAPADIEFGFLRGKLYLFQIRPFLESRKTRGSSYLIQMDQNSERNLDASVNMNEVPKA